MKPFDLEAAKAGAKLVTRDGREAVFIAHDPLAEQKPLVARLEDRLILFYRDGKLYDYCEVGEDLFMATTKRTVYVNLYKNNRYAEWYDSSKEAAHMAAKIAIAVAVPVEIEE